MDRTLRLRIEYEHGDEGRVTAMIAPVPGAISQGRTREKSRENALGALRLLLNPEHVSEGEEIELVELVLVEAGAALDQPASVA